MASTVVLLRALEDRGVLDSTRARDVERPTDPLAEIPMSVDVTRLTGHGLIVGYGRVGRRIGEALTGRGIPIVVAEQNREIVEQLRERGVPAVAGDAADPAVLIQAHVARARMLVIAVPDAVRARKMIQTALALRPDMQTVVRVHSDEEAALLGREMGSTAFMGEHELASGMTRHVLERIAGAGDPTGNEH